MKKVLIPAAVLAFAGAANAQASLYGLIDMCYGKSLLSDIQEQKADIHSGGDNGSSECNSTTRFGIKGAADLGGGTKANFKLESGGIESDGTVNDGGAFFARQAWFGFSGGFGEVRVGRQDSVSFQTMIDFDFNGASNGVSAGGYTGVAPWLPGRQSRSVQYISPAMGGLSAQVGLQPKGNGGTDAKDVFSLGVKFAEGPIAAAVSMQTKGETGGKNFSSVAGSYDFGVAKVMASYADGGSIAAGGSGKGYMLGVVAPVAGLNVGAHYASNTDSAAKLKSLEVFVNKEIFKNTYAYAELGDWKGTITTDGGEGSVVSKQKYSGFSVGVIFVF
jgi:predicted porin